MQNLPRIVPVLPAGWYPKTVLTCAMVIGLWSQLSQGPVVIHPANRFLGLLALSGLLFVLGVVGLVIRARTGRYELLSFLTTVALLGMPIAELCADPWDGVVLLFELIVLSASAMDAMHE